tara:strand:- start:556 stop:735 length:180 start_codon:yes stop_codon:yes gene_type:complete
MHNMEINLKQWNETEGRIRWVTKGVMSDGKKWTCYSFGVKQRKASAVKEMFTKGKWRTV